GSRICNRSPPGTKRNAPGAKEALEAHWSGGRTGTVSDTCEMLVTEGTRLGARYGLSTFVISRRRVSPSPISIKLPYVSISTSRAPSGSAGLPESSVRVPRVISVSPDGATWYRRTSSCTRQAAVCAWNETTGWPATRNGAATGEGFASAATWAAATTYVATSPGTTSGAGALHAVSSCSQPANRNGSEKTPPAFAVTRPRDVAFDKSGGDVLRVPSVDDLKTAQATE